MKRIWPELLILTAFICVCWFLYNQGKQIKQTGDYEAKMKSMDSSIQVLKLQTDSISRKEAIHETKIIRITQFYDSTKTNIYLLTDSNQFILLRSNIGFWKGVFDNERNPNRQPGI